jgi:hypothetical protein
MEKVVDKLDDQSVKIGELNTKVDLYRETQNQQTIKLEVTEKMATEAMASTKAAHKRLDDLNVPSKVEHETHDKRIGNLEKLVYWVGTLIIGSVILSMLGLVLIKK